MNDRRPTARHVSPRRQRFATAEVAVLAMAMALPAVMWVPVLFLSHLLAGGGCVPWGVIVLGSLFGLIIRRGLILAPA